MLDLLDVVYVMHVEQLERQVLSERQIAAVLRAAGGEVEIPSLAEARASFDAGLVADPPETSRAHELLRRWGVE